MSYKYRPSITGIDHDLAFSSKHVWLYVQLPAQQYEFRDYASREALAEQIGIGLEGLIQRADKSVECNMIVTSMPFDDYKWAKALHERTLKSNPSPYWKTFFRNMSNHVHNQRFRQREVFLGINLGNRSEFKSSSTLGPLRDISDLLTGSLGIKDYMIAEKELAFWHKRAEEYKRTLLYGHLKAKEITANTIARLIRETLYPSMEVPDVSASEKSQWGHGEIAGLGIAAIENNKKFLKITQTDSDGNDQEGYRATLCFGRFPDELDFPGQEPWIHYASVLSAPSTIFSRFTIEPAVKVEKEVSRKLKDAEDQANNSGGNVSYAIQEQIQTAHELKYSLSRDRKPWIYGRHRIVITGRTEEQLRNRVQETIDHYKNLDIDVLWPSGDQLNLLLESQPGDKVRVSAYYQRQELAIIPIGMPTGSGNVGDSVWKDPATGNVKGWIGPYIGSTTSRVKEPVFLSIHSAIARNKPPGLVITGAPGGGKSFSAFTITYIMALQGVWTIFIDPKGDALPLANLPGLEGRVKKFDLKYGHDGLLDPFTLTSDKSEQGLLAVETISLFVGGRMDNETQSALYDAIDQVGKQANPSLYNVVDVLLAYPTHAGVSLGRKLNLIRDMAFARLCFSPNVGDRVPFRAEDGLTIISLASLDLPATTDRENYSTSNHLAVGLMYLLVHYTESLMYSQNKEHPKAVVIDEAWSITTTPQGANMIPRLTRLGRSLNTAVILVSQNAGDFLKLTNNMSYRMAFGTRDKDEIQNVADFFGLEKGPDGKVTQGNAATIAGLQNGECLMKDADDNIARVRFDAWNKEMITAFDTNPETRGKA